MDNFAELEFGIYGHDVDTYRLQMRFELSDGTSRNGWASQHPVAFDFKKLAGSDLHYDPDAYGRALAADLFADEEAKKRFDTALSTAHARDLPLHVRLFIGPGAQELHGLRWETLCHPAADSGDCRHLFTGERVLFSRYLSSAEWRPVYLRSRTSLRALVGVASPGDLPPGLPPIDVEAELVRVRESLGDIETTELASAGNCSLRNLSDHLRDGYDILYLVAHGSLIKQVATIWLENPDGTGHPVSGRELADRMRDLLTMPRLVVLASCQSAGADRPVRGKSDDGKSAADSDRGGALSALGPLLAEVGVPAVVAMQGDISVPTAATLMPCFFRELRRDGQIDRAMSAARGAVLERRDWWAPALYTRLERGRIWYKPGVRAVPGQRGDPFTGLIDAIHHGRCTVILGTGLRYPLLGSSRDIARRLADRKGFPLSARLREDLPQVAQYLTVDYGWDGMLDALFAEMCRILRDRFDLPVDGDLDGMRHEELRPLLDKEMSAALERARQNPRFVDPYRFLAGLDIHTYVTTAFDKQLVRALRQAGKDPHEQVCVWNRDQQPTSFAKDSTAHAPSVAAPLVYYLFGTVDQPESLVLTEDDYFDYLLGATRYEEFIPSSLGSQLTTSPLLILGFRLEDWHFRVLLKSLLNQEGQPRKRIKRVAAQLEPGEGRDEEPEKARGYLTSYFSEHQTDIYWGSVDDILRDLKRLL